MDANRLAFFGFGSALIGAAITVWILLALQPAHADPITGPDNTGRGFATVIVIVLLTLAIYCYAQALIS